MFKVRASNEPTPVLSKILQQANERTSSWGGKMYFVYLPARGQVHPTRNFVLKTVKNLRKLKSGQLNKLNIEIKKSKLKRNLKKAIF